MQVVRQKERMVIVVVCGGTVLKRAPGHRAVIVADLSKMASGWFTHLLTQKINSLSRRLSHTGVWITEHPIETNKWQ